MRKKLDMGWWHLPLSAWLLLVAGTTATAQGTLQDQIHTAITAFIIEQTRQYNSPPRIEVGRLGPRLRIRPCTVPPSAFQPPGSRLLGNTTIGIRCNGRSPWTIYVPVQVQLFQPVAIVDRPLARGDTIREGDFKMVERDLGALKMGYITDARQPIGMVAKRPLGIGTLLTPQLLEAPRLVRRGEQVTIVAESGGLEIRASGEALADGARGDLVRIRNTTSRKVIEAVVVEPGVVKVRTGSHFP